MTDFKIGDKVLVRAKITAIPSEDPPTYVVNCGDRPTVVLASDVLPRPEFGSRQGSGVI